MDLQPIGTLISKEVWTYYDHVLSGVFEYENRNYIGMFLKDAQNRREEIWLMVPADDEQIRDKKLSIKHFYENSLSFYIFETDCILTEVFSIIPVTKEAIIPYMPDKYEVTFY